MKQVLLPILAAAAFIVVVGFLYGNPQKANLIFVTPTPSVSQESQKSLKIGSVEIKVTVARSDEARKKGLSGTKSLADNEGLLFVFSEKSEPAFWMKEMLIPIDIIWIAEDKIVKIDKNIPAPQAEAPDATLKLYKPGTPVSYVLEVNAGFSDKNKLKVGTPVDLSGV
jgi:hypothetical protein